MHARFFGFSAVTSVRCLPGLSPFPPFPPVHSSFAFFVFSRGQTICSAFAIRCKAGPARRPRAHSQIRTTRHPARRSIRLTRKSRARFPASFRRQNARWFFGLVACRGHPCQKQPSTKTASRAFRKTKSGRTENGDVPGARTALSARVAALTVIRTCRLHPEIWCARNNRASATSVSLFPRERMCDITSDRFDLVKTSGTEQKSHAKARSRWCQEISVLSAFSAVKFLSFN